MGIQLGSAAISKAYIGSNPVSKIMLGSVEVWAADGGSSEFSTATIDSAGTSLTVAYTGAVATAETVTLLSQEGATEATYDSGEGTSSIVYTLSRTVSSTDTLLASGSSFTLRSVTNNSAQARPEKIFDLAKQGEILPNTVPGYYPDIKDTRGIANWPWRVTGHSSTDHGVGGIWLWGAYGGSDSDPLTWTWETYDTAKARGAFDAFATKPTANPVYIHSVSNDGETPSLVKVGTDWYMTCHADVSAGGQPTILAISPDLLNWTEYDDGSGSSVVIDGAGSEYPGNEHRGYFRWTDNPFPSVAFNYVGYGLHGGGDYPQKAMYGCDDGISWEVVTMLDNWIDGALPAGWSVKGQGLDVSNITDLGNGEYAMLVQAGTTNSGGAANDMAIYEICLAADGHTVTRKPRLVLGLGGAGDPDEQEVAQPASILFDDMLLCVYQGADSALANTLMLATGEVKTHATALATFSRPNHEKIHEDFRGIATLPATLTKDGSGTITFDASGMNIPPSTGIASASTYVPATVGYFEIHLTQGYNSLGGIPAMQISATGPAASDDTILGYSSSGLGVGGHSRIRETTAAVQVNTEVPYPWQASISKRNSVGLRWNVGDDEAHWLGSGETVFQTVALTNANTAMSAKPRFANVAGSGGSIKIEQITMRIGTTGAGVAPTITAMTVATDSSVSFALSTDCLGDGSGITVKISGTPVTGVWSRTGLTNLTFAAASGTFAGSPSVTYDIASTDIRSVADLVTLQDVTGSAPVNTAAPVLSGTETEGQALSVTDGTWTGAPAPTYSYQWERDGSAISGATDAAYILQAADVGTVITCEVTATNPMGSTTATSNASGVISAPAAAFGGHATLETSLLRYHKLDSTSWLDSVGSKHLTATGTVSNPAGVIGNCLSKATGANYLSGDGSYTGAQSALTVAGWAKATLGAAGQQFTIAAEYDTGSSDRAWVLGITSNEGLRALVTDDGASIKKDYREGSYTDGTWRHFAFTFDSGALKLYVNGAEVSPTKSVDSAMTTIRESTTDFAIGAISGGGAWNNAGEADEVGVWSRALTASEIADLYNSGSGLTY